MRRILFTLLLCGVGSWGGFAAAPQFPLKVSENRRHLVDQRGTPFFYQADTANGTALTLRQNGGYGVLFEDAAWAKIQMYRWCPNGNCTATMLDARDKAR